MNKSKIEVKKIGIVVSDKMDKTRVVSVDERTPHPLYKKIIKKRKKFYAHDEENMTKVGDIVKIVQARPFSKLKRWRIVEIIEKTERQK